MSIVKIIEVRYTEDEIAVRDEDGQVYDHVDPPHDDDHTTITVYDELTAREAANLIRRHGLTFEATGNEWAANPDGSYDSDHATGERCETTAHGEGWHPRVWAAIADVVDA